MRGATALLTGGSSGIGPTIARTLHGRGTRLILTGRNQVRLRRIGDELRADVVVADLANANELNQLASEANSVDVLIANAALPGAGEVLSLTQADIDRVIDVNLRAAITLSRALSPRMVERRCGHIVFISSLAAAFPTPGLTLYNATKAALESYALSLRGELAPHDVGVSVVRLGPIGDAGMWADTGLRLPGLGTKSPHDVANAVIGAIERNSAQRSVAPLALRFGASAARLAPGMFARVAPRLGSSAVTEKMIAAHRDKR